MRLLHLHSGNLFGGAEIFMLHWMKATRDFTPHIDHHFALGWNGKFSQRLASLGTPVTEVGAVRTSRPWTGRAAKRKVEALIESYRPDIIVTHGVWQTLALLPPVVRVPTVLWVNDVPAPSHWMTWRMRKRAFDLLVTPSRGVTLKCEETFTSRRYETVPYILYRKSDARALSGLRRELRREVGIPDETVVLLQTGRAQAWKGHRQLIRFASQLRTNRPWEVWFVGGPQSKEEVTYFESLQRESARYGLDTRVRFWGQQDEVEKYFAAADIYCQFNERPESFGIVFVEALYAGLPVVTYDIGGASDIFSQAPGLICSPDRPDEALANLTRLIDDPEHRRAFSEKVRRCDLSFCEPKGQSEKISRLLEELSGVAAQAKVPASPRGQEARRAT